MLIAIPQLHALDVPTKRPSDYFAEMVKTDDHMTKVSLIVAISQITQSR